MKQKIIDFYTNHKKLTLIIITLLILLIAFWKPIGNLLLKELNFRGDNVGSTYGGSNDSLSDNDVLIVDENTRKEIIKDGLNKMQKIRNICAIMSAYYSINYYLFAERPEGWPNAHQIKKGKFYINRDFMAMMTSVSGINDSEGGVSAEDIKKLHLNYPTLKGKLDMTTYGKDIINKKDFLSMGELFNLLSGRKTSAADESTKKVDCVMNHVGHLSPVISMDKTANGYSVSIGDTNVQNNRDENPDNWFLDLSLGIEDRGTYKYNISPEGKIIGIDASGTQDDEYWEKKYMDEVNYQIRGTYFNAYPIFYCFTVKE